MQKTLMFLVTLAFSGAVCGGTIRVPEDVPTIQSAIDQAGFGDRIEIGPGTYREALRCQDKRLTIEGLEGPTRTVIDATGLGASVMWCRGGLDDGLTIRGLRLTGGRGHTEPFGADATVGGGVCVARGGPTFENCHLVGNVSSYEGGGAWVAEDANVRFLRCQFNANRAERGGGLLVRGGRVTLMDCLFSNNRAVFSGGGLAVEYGGHAVVRDTRFTECGSTHNGGGVSLYDSSALLSDVTFTRCSAGVAGGALYQGFNARLERSNLTFSTISDSSHGEWHGDLAPPKGACCIADVCIEVTQEACGDAGGRWAGAGTDCLAARVAACPVPRPGDLNDDDEIDIRDLALLMSLWGESPSSSQWTPRTP